MKVECRVVREGHNNHAEVVVTSSVDPKVSYKFSSYTTDACDVVEKLMEEEGYGQK